jgi:ATP-dependent exoDNAse (exonuclease V) beta subunit
VRRNLVIDRWWEDLAGVWIVDYKTSSHEGADLDAFLAGEEQRYRGQLERYAVALGRPGARRGLYFPLLKGWREWA